MTLLAYESSANSQPREGILLELPVVTYRIATGTRDIMIGGALYTASPAGHTEIKAAVVGSDGSTDLLVSLPMSHPACQRYMQQGVPPQLITVTVYRTQLADPDEEAVAIWRGDVLSFEIGRHVGTFRVPPRMSRLARRRIPTVTAGRGCPHVLYDTNCKVDRTTASAIGRTVTSINGRKVTFSGTPGSGQVLRGGDLYHPGSGMRLTIQDHTANVVTLQAPIPGLQFGDLIDLAPGCDHDVATCRDKYSNVANYGGAPNLPVGAINPFGPTGWGLYEST